MVNLRQLKRSPNFSQEKSVWIEIGRLGLASRSYLAFMFKNHHLYSLCLLNMQIDLNSKFWITAVDDPGKTLGEHSLASLQVV